MKAPKYRKHSVRDLGFVCWNKRRTYFPGPYNSPESKDAYRRFIEGNVTLPVRSLPSTSVLPVSSVVLLYLNYAKRHYGTGRTEYGNMKASLAPFLKVCGGDPAETFGPRRLKEYRESLVKQKLSRSYINGTINRIKRAFRWAVSEELIPANVYHGLQSVASLAAGRTEARETPKRQPVAWKHVEPVLGELSKTVAAMVRFQWYTGARSKSICMATASQFTLDKDGLWLWRPRHKTENRGKVLVLPIGPQAMDAITPFLGGEPDAFLFNPRRARKNRRYNARYTTGAYAYAIRRAIQRVNRDRSENERIPHWSPHQLRHAKGTSVRHSHGIEAAQAVLGHDSLDATEIYSEARLELAKRVARETG